MLSDLFQGSQHVQSVGLDRSLDIPLWNFARDNGFVIVTKDVDFSDRSAIAGHPPKIIWIRIGNCTTSDIESAIRKNHERIAAFDEDEELGVLALLG